VFGVGRDREYDLAHVRRLRVVPHVSDPYGWRSTMRWWGVGGGSLAFDYGAKTVQFGAVDEAEGHDIVEELRSRHVFDAA
jgi:hypothetical protein